MIDPHDPAFMRAWPWQQRQARESLQRCLRYPFHRATNASVRSGASPRYTGYAIRGQRRARRLPCATANNHPVKNQRYTIPRYRRPLGNYICKHTDTHRKHYIFGGE